MEQTFISLNTRGLKDRDKRLSLFFSLKSEKFSVAFLQECHLSGGKDVSVFVKDWEMGPSVWCVGNVHADGLGILFKKGGFLLRSF